MTQERGFNKLFLASAVSVDQMWNPGTLLFLFLNLGKRGLLCLLFGPGPNNNVRLAQHNLMSEASFSSSYVWLPFTLFACSRMILNIILSPPETVLLSGKWLWPQLPMVAVSGRPMMYLRPSQVNCFVILVLVLIHPHGQQPYFPVTAERVSKGEMWKQWICVAAAIKLHFMLIKARSDDAAFFEASSCSMHCNVYCCSSTNYRRYCRIFSGHIASELRKRNGKSSCWTGREHCVDVFLCHLSALAWRPTLVAMFVVGTHY